MRRGAAALAALTVALVAGCGGATHEQRAPAASTEALRYVAIGDSYSSGAGASAADAWPQRLAETLTQNGLRVDLVANLAQPGWTTDQALDGELPKARAARPDVVSVLIGTNDALRSVTVKNFRARLRSLLAALIALTGQARRVLVVTLPDFSVAPAMRAGPQARTAPQLWATFENVVLQEAERAGTPTADVSATSRAMAGDPTLVAPDGLHPSARELALWTGVIAPVARQAWRGL